MKVGVLSDTHLRKSDNPKPVRTIIKKHFSECSAILHAGDLVYLDIFYEIIPDGVEFIAVTGNMDLDMTRDSLPSRRIVTLEGHRIGLVHGSGSPGLVHKKAMQEFEGEDLSAIVFGHSHRPMNEVINGILLFNPGSPTDRRFAPSCSVGLLEIGEGISGRIIQVEGN